MMLDIDNNIGGINRRNILKSVGSLAAFSAAQGIGSAKRNNQGKRDIVRFQGTYRQPVNVEQIHQAQKKRTQKWLGVPHKNVRPATVPTLDSGERIVDYRLVNVDGQVRQYIGTAYGSNSVREAKGDGEKFETAALSDSDFTTQQEGGASLTTSGWDWSYFGRYNAVDKPAGKVTLGSTWLGKEDCPNSGDFGYGIVSEWEQIPGTTVDGWSNGGHWWNRTVGNGVVNEWHNGDFNATGYEYGPKNSAGSTQYSYSAGFAGTQGPTLGVDFTTEIEGGAKNDSDYTLPEADHYYQVTNAVDTSVISMAPASSAFIDKSQINSNDQALTYVTATGSFEHTGFSTDTSTPSTKVRYLI